MILRTFGSILVTAGLLFSSPADDPALAPEAVKPLERVAKELAKAGWLEELEAVLDALRLAGMDPDGFQKLAAGCRGDAAKVKKPAASVPTAARTLQKLAAELALRLPKAEVSRRRELAQLILELDRGVDAAQIALGRVNVSDDWRDPSLKAREERQAALGAAVARARALEVKIDAGPSIDPRLPTSESRRPSLTRHGPILLHGVWPAQKLERVLRQSLRALALANWYMCGEVRLPVLAPSVFVIFDAKAEFQAAVRQADAKGKVDKAMVAILEETSAIYIEGEYVGYKLLESELEASIFWRLLGNTGWKAGEEFSLNDAQPGPVTGLANWCCHAILGTRVPILVIDEQGSASSSAAGTIGGMTEKQRQLRERMLRFADAGMSGGRAWLQYLAEQRQDPQFADALQAQAGEIQGDALLKATFVLEFLALDGPLLPMMRKLITKESGSKASQQFVAASGRPLPELEAAWREWFIPPRKSLVERLGMTANDGALELADQRAAESLNSIRTRAGSFKSSSKLDPLATDQARSEVEFDRAVSDSCRRHALYLAANRDQLDRWPDAHEEYPDRSGFDVAGAWAGAHSVIAPGVKDVDAAIDQWMGTFFHRLPLLQPGLLRFGCAFEDGIAVLDSGSFVRPRRPRRAEAKNLSRGDVEWWGIAWPPANARDVPTRFVPELPTPVPGEDQSNFGYPITLQLKECYRGVPEVSLTLHAGDAKGAEVPCWFSTPKAPTNPMLAPDDTWCLIPKSPLLAGGTYTVTATFHVVAEEEVNDAFAWSFRCGK